MRGFVVSIFVSVVLLAGAHGQGMCGRVTGQVVEVRQGAIVTAFPCPVRSNSVMIVLTGEGEAVAAMAVSGKCSGDGPYRVAGDLVFTSDASGLALGKEVYVNSLNADVGPSTKPTAFVESPSAPALGAGADDLRLYYFAAGQNVGYGALGLGYERTLGVSSNLALQLDGGITGIGNITDSSFDDSSTTQLIENLNGRALLALSPGFSVYAGYRWNEARGDAESWSRVMDELQDETFTAGADLDDRTVRTQGFEYGFSLQPFPRVGAYFGYLPRLKSEYTGYGARTEPAYTAELRFRTGHGGIRLRGLRFDDYWQADLGITIR